MSAYCPHCMEPIDAGHPCSRCGGDVQPAPRIAHHLPPGTVLANGRYLVGRALGQGGFGITYIGRDLTLNMRVAIKEYYPASYVGRNCEASNELVALDANSQARLEAGRRRFLDEARVLAKFHNSPGIVDVRDFFEQNGTAYIVMDYLEGETLKDHLQHATIGADQAFSLMQPIMGTLELIHADHVIHRDISPDNIMLCSDGKLCLMDFGAAHEMDYTDQRTVSMVLKSGYAPEEQYRAKGELGPWTDIYALCATMYRAITGIAPDESLQRVIGDEMAWPSEMGISISPVQERVLKKGMAPRHADRYQSIAELKRDLAVGNEETEVAGAPTIAAHAEEAVSEPGELENASLTHVQDGQPNDSNSAENESEMRSPAHPPARRRKWTIPAAIAAFCAVAALVALFLFTPAFTVNFDSAGGSAVAPVSVSRMQAVDQPATPQREGFAFTGWFLDDSLETEASFPLKVDSDTTLHASWKKTVASYRVEYRDAADGSEVADAKTVEGAKVGSEVSEQAPEIDGYELDSNSTATFVVSEDDADNFITFPYRRLVSYEVRYRDANADYDVSPPKTEEGIAEGTQVTETAPEIAGYTLKSEPEQSIALKREAEENVIVFYYEPIPVAVQSSGGSSGGGSSSGNKKSDDIKWAN